MDIPFILSRIRPNAEWGWKGESYSDPSNLDWRDSVQVVPTLTELQDEWAVIEAENTAADTVRDQLKDAYALLVGRQYASLTNAELRLMSEIHTYILGGIDEVTRNLKPANKWDVARKLLKAT